MNQRKVIVRIGDFTPWGAADEVREIIPDVLFVGTPSHGGFKLGPDTNARIPQGFRRVNGWYEEDCEYAIPVLFIPELAHLSASADQTVRGHWPDEYEAHFGVILAPGESRAKDERRWAEAHKADWIATAAWGAWCPTVPKGMVGVVACLGGKRGTKERWALVPDAEYANRDGWGYVVPADAPTWCGPDARQAVQ